MDLKLLDILVCPLCKSPLLYRKAENELICKADRLAFPIKDGIPVMLEDEARTLFHEFGHALMARVFRTPAQILILPFGGAAMIRLYRFDLDRNTVDVDGTTAEVVDPTTGVLP